MMRRLAQRLLLVSGLVAFFAGCADSEQRAAIYRAEAVLHEASKAEAEARLGTTPPDSATLLAVREKFLKVRAAIPGPYRLDGNKEHRALALQTLRLVGGAEAAGVRLALEARRPDLAVEAAKRLHTEAADDTATARQAAFMEVAALQGMRHYEEAIARMKAILQEYRPMPPPENGEDPVLAIPDAIVNLRRSLGDEEGAQREVREGLAYYQRVLSAPQVPAVEAQVRARVLRSYLEIGQVGKALEEANTLEHLVASTPSLRSMLAEVAFAKGKIRAQTEKDPREGIAILDKLAIDFPESPLAPRAMFEAGVQAEAKGLFDVANEHYKAVLERFPSARDVPAMSLFRIGLLQEKKGDWTTAKGTLESVPVRFPSSVAAAETPMAIMQHYLRDNRKAEAELYVPKALATYRSMIQSDSTGGAAPLYRAKMFQIYMARRDSAGIYSVTDEMYRADPRHPFTAQMLLQAAKAAQAMGNTRRGVGFLRQFLQAFPNSPLAPDVRREIGEHGGGG